MRRVLGVLACVLALGGGAFLAEHSMEQEHAPVATPRPVAPVALVRTSRAEPAEPTPVPAPDLVITADEARARRGLGEAYADGLVLTGATPHRLILFTFDDGPDRRTTPRLLHHLDELGVRAVFFITSQRLHEPGARALAERGILRDIVRRGHVVGNHTRNHEQLPLLDASDVLAELGDTDRVFEEELGGRSWLMRPPGGSRSPRVDRLVASRGYTQVLWNLGTGDFQVRDADSVVETFVRVLQRRELDHGERGGIVLMHDTHDWSVEAFPRIVGWLRDRNCELLEAGEELYDIVDDPALFFAARGDAEPGTEAPSAEPSETVLAARQARLREVTSQRCGRLASR
ncbi:MAG: polysaccharide deacetylase family protein [Sandaracinus sp.]|nr:polysaccharide deacetylase family protein [Sandaracinus sp.]